MCKFTERKRLRLARIVMVRSALREHCSLLIALDAPPHSLAPHHLSLAFFPFSHCSFPSKRAHSRETTFWFTRTRDLSQFSIHGAVGGASPCASARSTAHFLDRRPILSVSEHQQSPQKHHLEYPKPCRAEWWPTRFHVQKQVVQRKAEKRSSKIKHVAMD